MLWIWFIAPLAFSATILMKMYNSMVNLRNNVKMQWAQMHVQIKRRNDLIINIVETVKGYTKHEEYTLTSVISARNAVNSARTQENSARASDMLTNTLSRLFAVSEAYPELKADEGFKELRDSMRDTEDRIAYSRQFYNESVYTYNNFIQTIPNMFFAKVFGFKPECLFEATTEENEMPKVTF